MHLAPAIIASLIRRVQPTDYLRTTRWTHRTTPLGMGYEATRLASPTKRFNSICIAKDLSTSIAKAIVRDRFEGDTVCELAVSDVAY